MCAARPKILFVTDLTYPAAGRRYGDEDVFLSSQLREDFHVALCHPLDAVALMEGFDAVVMRNSGPVLHYQREYDELRARAARTGTRMFNQLTGKADMRGKQYLVDLTAAGYPVIPTVDSAADLARLPHAREYVVKPKLGADSIGLRVVAAADLEPALTALPREAARDSTDSHGELLVQPRVPFDYEVSFYFVDRTFRYALHAPNTGGRWELKRYEPSEGDLAFAQRFVDWNAIDHGIQRVDACRTEDGDLLLVELEDLNPYLSLDLLDEPTRAAFVRAMTASLRALLDGGAARG